MVSLTARINEAGQALESLKAPADLALSKFIGTAADDMKNFGTEAEKVGGNLVKINGYYSELKTLVTDTLRARGAEQAVIDRATAAIESRRVVEVNTYTASTKGAKERAGEENKLAEFVRNTTEQIKQRIANLQEERDVIDALTPVEQLRNRILQGQAGEFAKLTTEQRKNIDALFARAKAIEDENAVIARQREVTEATVDAWKDYALAYAEATKSAAEFAVIQLRVQGVSEEEAKRIVALRANLEGLSQSYADLREAQADTAALDAQNKELERQVATLFGGVGALEQYRAAELRATAAVYERNAPRLSRTPLARRTRRFCSSRQRPSACRPKNSIAKLVELSAPPNCRSRSPLARSSSKC